MIKKINEKCVISEEHQPPAGIQMATRTNADRDAINAAVFHEFITKHAPKDGSYVSWSVYYFNGRFTNER